MANWNLKYLYETDELWEKDLANLSPYLEKFKSFQGKLNNFKDFREFKHLENEFEEKVYKLYLYIHLSSDLDLKDLDKQSKLQKLMFLLNQVNQNTSYVSPELISIGKEKIISFIDQDKSLEEHRFPVEKLFFAQSHVLSNLEEKLLSNFSNLHSIPTNLYQGLSIVDAKNSEITLSNNEKVTVTPSNYRSLIQNSTNENDRKLVFEALYERYLNNKTTYANIYNLVLQNKKANYTSRNFESHLDSALFNNNIPTSVFHNLKDVAYDNTNLIKRYINLRKKHLKLDKYHTYDRFLNLVNDDTKYSYEKSREIFFESIKHFDNEFVNKQKEAIKEGFVDVTPKDGKRTGAYSSGVYGNHPYILLNHDETLDSLFTLVHEAGHSAHTLFSNEAQPMAISSYTIFVAEIASTFNEHVLLDYLIKNAKNKNEKIALIEKAIDGIMATFFRQTLFATYEFIATEKVKNGEPINSDVLSKIMIDLYQHYYDIDITLENGKQYVWAYIPHLFHTPFYVYQYATSYSASLKIFKDVKDGKKGAMENYVKMLKLGGSMYPVDEAKIGGADLTTKEPFLAVINHFESLIDELEKTLEN